ncbi:MAG: phospholipase D-like domain-containing protein [Planctomycetota bacterium]
MSSRSETRARIEASFGQPFVPGNQLDRLKNGVEIFPALFEAVRGARWTIDFLTFIYWRGDVAYELAQLFAAKAREGIRVRVLLDGVGSLKMDPELRRTMTRAGVDVRTFRPPSTWRLWRLDHRTHRKILVVDGRVGFTGGVGIATEWEGDAEDPEHWRDDHFRLRGPALVGLHAAFVGNWMEVARTVANEDLDRFRDLEEEGAASILSLRSTASVGWSDLMLLVHLVAACAQGRLRLTTPYFVPDEETVRLLCAAAERGVVVEVLTAGRYNDQRVALLAGRVYFQRLLDAGVEIHLFDRTMMHTKALTLDGWFAVVGSPNWNHRSLRKDDELCLVVDDDAFVRILDADFDEDLEASRTLDAARWAQRGWSARLAERVCHAVRHEL